MHFLTASLSKLYHCWLCSSFERDIYIFTLQCQHTFLGYFLRQDKVIENEGFLTLFLPAWRIWWAPNNASSWQMGVISAFKESNTSRDTNIFPAHTVMSYKRRNSTVPLILNLNPRLRWAVNFTIVASPLQWTLNRKKGGSWNPYGLVVGKKKFHDHSGNWIPQP